MTGDGDDELEMLILNRGETGDASDHIHAAHSLPA